jgi:peptide/nickel transport system ATP-binding protein
MGYGRPSGLHDSKYTEKLLASVPEMDPDWLDTLLQERLSTFV